MLVFNSQFFCCCFLLNSQIFSCCSITSAVFAGIIIIVLSWFYISRRSNDPLFIAHLYIFGINIVILSSAVLLIGICVALNVCCNLCTCDTSCDSCYDSSPPQQVSLSRVIDLGQHVRVLRVLVGVTAVVFRGKTLYSHLAPSSRVYKWVTVSLMLEMGHILRMTLYPLVASKKYSLFLLNTTETRINQLQLCGTLSLGADLSLGFTSTGQSHLLSEVFFSRSCFDAGLLNFQQLFIHPQEILM